MVRNTVTTRDVLDSFLRSAGASLYGLDIIRETGHASGTVYPILRRLEHEGWLASRWESIDPVAVGRPARRMYSITAEGVAAARRFEAEVAARKAAATPWHPRLPGSESPA